MVLKTSNTNKFV